MAIVGGITLVSNTTNNLIPHSHRLYYRSLLLYSILSRIYFAAAALDPEGGRDVQEEVASDRGERRRYPMNIS